MVCMQVSRRDFDEVEVRVNQIMDQVMQKPFFRFRTCDRWQPSVNLYETESVYHLCVDLAGIDPKQTEIKVEDGVLYILGHRSTPSPMGGSPVRIHVMEIDSGPFHRAITIPDDVDSDRIEANYQNGFLWITLPKNVT